LIIITAGTEVKGLPEEYKGFKIKIMDVHDKQENEFLQVVIYPLVYSIAECTTRF
jgi:hypothetical protein